MIKKLDKERYKLHPYLEEEDMLRHSFFMTNPFTIMDQIIFQIETTALALYSINQDIQNKQILSESIDYLLDSYISNQLIRYVPQSKSICMTINRLFSNLPSFNHNYFDQIEQNPCIIQKNMPFNINYALSDCKECYAFKQKINLKLNEKKLQLQKINASQQEYMKQFQQIREEYTSQKCEVVTHTRIIEFQVNVNQDIFLNQIQLNKTVIELIYNYQKNLQILLNKFFQLLEITLNPSKSIDQQIFEFKQISVLGSLLHKNPETIITNLMKFTNIEKFDIVIRNLKQFCCQVSKLFRYLYFMNLIGKDPNDLTTLQQDRPVLRLEKTEDQNQVSRVFLTISRQNLDFDILLKVSVDLSKQQLFFYTSNNIKEPINSPEKNAEYRENLANIFKLINNPDSEFQSVTNQIKNVSNYYQIINYHYRSTPTDPLYQLNQQTLHLVKLLLSYKVVIDFSKKDVDIMNVNNPKIIQPKYLFEIISYYDFINSSTIKKKIYFARCKDNKIFTIVSDNEDKKSETHFIDFQSIDGYLSKFVYAYFVSH